MLVSFNSFSHSKTINAKVVSSLTYILNAIIKTLYKFDA